MDILPFGIAIVVIVAVLVVVFASPDSPPSIFKHDDTYLEKFIEFVMTRFQRQIRRRLFFSEFGFKAWLFVQPSDVQKATIDAKLSDAADVLNQAYAVENDLHQRIKKGPEMVRRAVLRDVKQKTERAKKEFWFLHNLAHEVAGYPDHYKCSYTKHLASPIQG